MSQEVSKKYSLWMVPKGEAGAELQALVDTLADDNNAPRFVPHLTLVANIFADDSEITAVREVVERLSKNIGSFAITLTQYGYLDEEFRCLFLLAESPDLQRVYETTAEIFPQVNDEHFAGMPHMSVLYGVYSEAVKQRNIADNPVSPVTFTVSDFDLFLTEGSVEDWQHDTSFPLQS